MGFIIEQSGPVRQAETADGQVSFEVPISFSSDVDALNKAFESVDAIYDARWNSWQVLKRPLGKGTRMLPVSALFKDDYAEHDDELMEQLDDAVRLLGHNAVKALFAAGEAVWAARNSETLAPARCDSDELED